MPVDFQYSNSPTLAEMAAKKAREILDLINFSRKQNEEPKSKSLPKLNFESVKIERRGNVIFYTGPVSNDLKIIGFIDFEGNGEEVLIRKYDGPGSKKHKIRMFKTTLNKSHQRHDYFTRTTIESLTRVRIN